MLRRLVAAAVAGVLLWSAFPAADVWIGGPLGVAVLVAACRGSRVLTGAGSGLLAGLVWFVPYVSWTGLHVGAMPWFALAGLQAAFVALFGAMVSLVGGGAGRPRSERAGARSAIALVDAVACAAAWSTAEWARASLPFGGFPWGRIAYSQADGPLVHVVRWGGPAAVGFVVAFVGVLLLHTMDAVVRSRHGGWGTAREFGVPFVAAVAVVVAAGLLPTTWTPEGRDIRVMAVQGSAPQTGLDFNAQRRQILDNHGRVTLQAAGHVAAGQEPRPDLVVWPENASDIDPFVNEDAGRIIDAATDAIGSPVLVGAVLGGGRSDLTNTSILWLPGEGASAQRYHKRELVPFAEYMPYRSFFRAITRKVDLLERDFVPGLRPGTMAVSVAAGRDQATIGVGICFEVAIDHVMDDVVREGADLLVVQTNNAMFDRSAESAQQLAISRVRAMQYGRAVVHASNVGISALVTPDGVAHQPTELFTATTVQGELPLLSERTLGSRVGMIPDAVLALLTAAALLTRAAPRGQHRRAGRVPADDEPRR